MYQITLNESVRGMQVPVEIGKKRVYASRLDNLIEPLMDLELIPESGNTHVTGVLYAHSVKSDCGLTVKGKVFVEGDLNARSLSSEENVRVDGKLSTLGDAKSYKNISAGYIRSAGNVIAGSIFSLDGIRAKGNIVGVRGIGSRGNIRGGTIYCNPKPGIWAYDRDGIDCEVRAEGILPSRASLKRGYFVRV